MQTGFNNIGSTVSTGEQAIVPTENDCNSSWCENGGNIIEHSVWFKFIAPPSGKVQVSLCDLADFDAQIAVYQFANCADFANVSMLGANDDGPASCATAYDSELELAGLIAGSTYHILVDGWTGATGNFGIKITEITVQTVANDLPCNAIPIPVNGTVQTGFSNLNATVSADESALAPTATDCNTSWCENGGNTIQHSVWFKFVAPASGKVEVSTCGLAEFDSQLAVYKSADCGIFSTFTLLGANDDGPTTCATDFDSQLELAGLTAGATYFVMVDGHATATGLFGIKITEIAAPPAPGNDLVCNAIALPVNGTVQPGFTNVNATASAGEQAIVPTANDCNTSWCETGGNVVSRSVWFKFVAPASGKVEVSTCGLAEFDTQLAVYKSTDCANFGTFTLVGANDDGPTTCHTGFDSRLEIAGLVSGTTYWVMVDGYGTSAGLFGIKITELPTVGTGDFLEEKTAMHLFPNPASERITVQFDEQVFASNLLVFNALGQLVKTISTENMAATGVEIDLGGLAAGSYVVRASTKEGRQLVGRFLKK